MIHEIDTTHCRFMPLTAMAGQDLMDEASAVPSVGRSGRSTACRINVVCMEGSAPIAYRYQGVFASRGAAFDDALERFPTACYIGVLMAGGVR